MDRAIPRPVLLRHVQESWTRCRTAGLSPHAPLLPALEGERLVRRRRAMRPLLGALLGELDHFPDVRDRILICDAGGVVLWPPNQTEGSPTPFRPGVSLAEHSAGTNAVALAILLKQGVLVQKGDHYLIGLRRWSAAAVPVLEPDGNLVGVAALVSTDPDELPPAALGVLATLVHMAAEAQRLQRLAAQVRTLSAFTHALTDAMPKPVAVLDEVGRVICCNDGAAALMQGERDSLAGRYLSHILRLDHPSYSQLQGMLRLEPVDLEGVPVGHIATMAEPEVDPGVRHGHEGLSSAFASLVGRSPAFAESLRVARAAARSNAPVLILGESGTGKELCAQAIHQASQRSQRPLITVNCSAIVPELAASELFGYARGAFTGARQGGSIGKFEAAHGGTLFLDEIGDMPLDAQCALLRVLEEGQVTRVGHHQPIPIDVRVIAATNRDLWQEVARGRFRQDLLYRLQVLEIHLPPLRERLEDIPLLVHHFLQKFSRSFRRPAPTISADALACLRAHHWPGNVRELENAIVCAAHLAEDRIEIPHLPPYLRTGVPPAVVGEPPEADDALRVRQALEAAKGNRSRAAEILGISRRHLYRKLERYGLL